MNIEVAAKSIINSKLDENYSIHVYETIVDLEDVWDEQVPMHKFFSKNFLLESCRKKAPLKILDPCTFYLKMLWVIMLGFLIAW